MHEASGFPPHVRGWTPGPIPRPQVLDVSPACAGMDRGSVITTKLGKRFPRMCGDGPVEQQPVDEIPRRFPPHVRGWTHHRMGNPESCPVSPACAGMDPS